MEQLTNTDAKSFCDLNAEKVARIVKFLANAKICKVAYKRSGKDFRVGLRLGKTTIEVWSVYPDAWTLFLDAVFKKFELNSEWKKWRNQRRRNCGYPYNEMNDELESRGGSGLSKLFNLGAKVINDKNRLRMIQDAQIQADLNRSLAFLRKARASGATVRQMNKLVKTVLAEEAMREVQES